MRSSGCSEVIVTMCSLSSCCSNSHVAVHGAPYVLLCACCAHLFQIACIFQDLFVRCETNLHSAEHKGEALPCDIMMSLQFAHVCSRAPLRKPSSGFFFVCFLNHQSLCTFNFTAYFLPTSYLLFHKGRFWPFSGLFPVNAA